MPEAESILVVVRNHLRNAEEAVKAADFDYAMQQVDLAIEAARNQDNSDSLAAAYYGKAAVIWGSGGTSEDAHHYGHLAIQHTKANTRTDLMVRTLMARIKAGRGNFDAAILLNEDVLRYYYETNDLAGQADILRSLGDVYRAMRQYNKAQERYFAALQVYQNHDDPLNLAGLLLSLGALMYQIEDFDQARRYWAEARSIAEAQGFRHVLNKIDEAFLMLDE